MRRYQRDRWAISAPVAGGYVVVPLRRNEGRLEENVLLLEDVAARVWELLEEPHSRADLESTLVEEYAVELPQVRTDLERFLNQLREVQAAEVLS